MWYPSSLKIVNLFSYQDSTIDFLKHKGRMTCIYGSNQTDPKTLSNGSGKTSLLDCIAIALTGSPLRQINKRDIVRNGYTNGSLELVLQNDVLNKTLVIKELIEKTKSNKVELYENGILNTQLKDLAPKEAHKYILSLIDISEDDLLNYYLLGKDTYQSFFTTKDSEKKEVINGFSRANIVDPIDGFIKEDIKGVEVELSKIDQVIAGKNAKIEVLEEQVLDLKLVDKDEVKKKAIEVLEGRIVEISEKIDEFNAAIENIQFDRTQEKEELQVLEKDQSISKKLKQIVFQIESTNANMQKEREVYIGIDKEYEPRLLDIDQQIDTIEKNIEDYNIKKTKVTKLILEVRHHIADEIECPKCFHKFCFEDKEYDLKTAKEELPSWQNEIDYLNEKVARLKEIVAAQKELKQALITDKSKEQNQSIENGNKFKSQLLLLSKEEEQLNKALREQSIKINNLTTKILNTDNGVKIKRDHIVALNKQIADLFLQIDAEEKGEIEDKITPVQNQIEQIRLELLDVDFQKTQLVQKIESLNAWRQRFKKFKSHLANNSIGMIESLSNHYLQGMGTSLSVVIDGFKEKADGTLKEEIITDISRDGGISLESFYKFSGGEKAKVDLAGILSLQKIINLNSQSGGLDLLWIDEVVDAIDRIALGELISSLDNVGQTILLISHIDLPEIENSIKVEKKLGISQIIE